MGACCSKDVEYEWVTDEDRSQNREEDVRIGEDGSLYRLRGSSKQTSMFIKQGQKGVNQDAIIVCENFNGEEGSFFCGVFDGHGPSGHKMSQYVRDTLPSKLHSAMKSSEFTFENVNESEFSRCESSFVKCFREIDEELGVKKSSESYCSGSTAVTVIKQGDCLVIANLGDSRALLCSRGSKNQLLPLQLTLDLKPTIPSEADRIKQCKGRVFAIPQEPDVFRVWMPNEDCPGLAMSRAFGDFCLKDCGLISVPQVAYKKVTPKDEFIVIATDGIWDVLSNAEVVKTVASAKTRSMAAEILVKRAAKEWKYKYPGSRRDDCSAVVLYLKNEPILQEGSSHGAGLNDLWNARVNIEGLRKANSLFKIPPPPEPTTLSQDKLTKLCENASERENVKESDQGS